MNTVDSNGGRDQGRWTWECEKRSLGSKPNTKGLRLASGMGGVVRALGQSVR